MVLGSIRPAVFFYQGSSNFLEFVVVEDPLRATLHIDLVAGIDQGFRGRRSQRRTMFQSLSNLGTKVQVEGHVLWYVFEISRELDGHVAKERVPQVSGGVVSSAVASQGSEVLAVAVTVVALCCVNHSIVGDV